MIVGTSLWAQGPQRHSAPQRRAGGHNDFNAGRERFRQISPEDRQRFSRNAERWMKMNPEERKIMRERERLRRERIKQEAEAALRDSGLRLDAEKRAQFEARYLQERTRIEHAMRQELESKRRQQLPALVEELKKEFQEQQQQQRQQQSAATSPGPAATPK